MERSIIRSQRSFNDRARGRFNVIWLDEFKNGRKSISKCVYMFKLSEHIHWHIHFIHILVVFVSMKPNFLPATNVSLLGTLFCTHPDNLLWLLVEVWQKCTIICNNNLVGWLNTFLMSERVPPWWRLPVLWRVWWRAVNIEDDVVGKQCS